MTKRALLERIEALEARVAELEAQPRQPYPLTPWGTPRWAEPCKPAAQPLPARWWDQIQGGTTSIETQAAYDHDGLRSSGRA